MNYSIIRYILSSVVCFEGVFLALPSIIGAIYGEEEGFIYGIVSIICILAGFAGRYRKPKSNTFYSREGFVAVSLSWILLSIIGALPMCLTGEIPFYIDAVFEIVSGFTTTGASIMPSVEILSHASAFWRLFTHWIGGMGVLVFIMAVLPLSGGSNMHLMRAESPGPSVSKLVPRVKHTAMILYGIYCIITIIETAALLIAGLNFFDALTLSFATAGTGGFALLNSSIASYSVAVQNIITVFMLACSVNFNVYYLLLIRKGKEALLNEEVRYFLIIVFASALLIALNIKGSFGSFFEAFHHSVFQVASVISTTGFATCDFNMWPEFSRAILVLLMFVGACAGSTGGGLKISRLIILAKAVKNEARSIVHPRSVNRVRINGKGIQDSAVKTVLVYLAAYVLIVIISFLIVSLDRYDMTTNFTAVAATFNNIGPGLGAVGATGNYGGFSVLSKLVLIFDMLIGRLEIFPMLVLLSPGTWRVRQSSSTK